jgi:hypothetical protein
VTLVGRSSLVSTLQELVLAGEHAILFGPVGVGKSTLLHALEHGLKSQGVRVGLAPSLRQLENLISALGRAHPDVEVAEVSARIARSRLRNAAGAHASVLLLDGVRGAGTMVKGLLRSLRGTGTGVLLAVDVNTALDHANMRRWRVARREIEVPRLHANSARTLIQATLTSHPPPYPITRDDLVALVRASEGLPGRAISLVSRLAAASSWHEGRVRVGSLRAAAAIDELERYRADFEALEAER